MEKILYLLIQIHSLRSPHEPNEYSILDKYGYIDEVVLTGRRLLFPEYFEEVQKRLGKTGLLGLYIPKEYGGLGLPYTLYSCVIEILSGGDANFGVHASIHGTAADLINRFGTEALKDRLLPDMASGKKLGCLIFTEASG